MKLKLSYNIQNQPHKDSVCLISEDQKKWIADPNFTFFPLNELSKTTYFVSKGGVISEGIFNFVYDFEFIGFIQCLDKIKIIP